jgi:hypothetical protein
MHTNTGSVSISAAAALLLLAATCSAQWTSPGTGEYYTAEDLVAASAGALTGSWPEYTQTMDIVISAGDTLDIAAGCGWTALVAGGPHELRVHGLIRALGTVDEGVEFRSSAGQPGNWSGIVLDEASPDCRLVFTDIRHGDRGLSVLGGSPLFEFGTLAENLSTGLHCFLGGNPVVRHTLIEGNRRYGVEVTGGSSPVLRHCVIRGNNTEGTSARNAVSVGIQGSNSPRLEYCLLEGLGPANPASGFSLWLAGNPLVSNCEIRDFRSGVVIQGSGAQGRLERCWIHDNRYTNPIQGGSGININSTATPVFRDCVIQNNDWGVTLTSTCAPDFGQVADPGANGLWGNGNGGQVYDFFNNTTSPVQAVGNWWGTTDPAVVESHINDNTDGNFGEVVFQPLHPDSLLAPLVRPGLGWRTLADTAIPLALRPADHFRNGSALDLSASGHGTWQWQQDSLFWQPLAGDPDPALLVLQASDALGRTAVDSLWVFHPGVQAADTPALVIQVVGPDLLLQWTAVEGATAYRVYRPVYDGGPDELLLETQQLEWLIASGNQPGFDTWRVRAVLPEEQR